MIDKPLANVWATRDFPVLVEVTRQLDKRDQPVPTAAVAEAIDMDVHEVERACSALMRRGLIDDYGSDFETSVFSDVSGQAYLMTGLHPDGDEVLDRLISALEQAAERTGDPEERGKLRRAATALASLTRDVAVNVVGAVVGVAITT